MANLDEMQQQIKEMLERFAWHKQVDGSDEDDSETVCRCQEDTFVMCESWEDVTCKECLALQPLEGMA